MRRNHSVQYISIPGFPWDLLRKNFPEKYETHVDLVPGEWTKVKIEVNGEKARLFMHDSSQPTLLVNDLKAGINQRRDCFMGRPRNGCAFFEFENYEIGKNGAVARLLWRAQIDA